MHARAEESTWSTGIDLCLVPNRTLHEYRCECAGLIDVNRFDAMVVDDKSLNMYTFNRFERGTALGA